MKKAASIFLRADIVQEDIRRLTLWLQNQRVTRFLNEDARVVDELNRLLADVPAPMLRYHMNQQGRFFLVCPEGGGPIGFLKLREHAVGTYEMVIVIGDETLWGNGYGRQAVRAAVAKVFLEWRGRSLTARIYHGHTRSVGLVCGCGVRERERLEKLSCYRITREEYLAQAGRGGSLRYGT